jgi:hypothetical protein
MSIITQTACVVIPVYQTKLAPHEQVALDRCISVLKKHPIILVTPHRVDTQRFGDQYPDIKREIFKDEFFDGVAGYNRMLLSDEFYERFSQYEFMLIHQLDAFVFSDQLLNWCSRGYDYVGAPWLPWGRGRAFNLPQRISMGIRGKLYRWLDIHHRDSKLIHYLQLRYSVGNGGFSLRRIAAMRQALSALPNRVESYRRGTRLSWGEDIFFCIEANRYRRHVKVPSLLEAVHFAWEINISAALQLSEGKLPFGCHAWDKLHREEWRPIFARFGYSLDEILPPE